MKLIATICKSSCLFFMLLVFFTACNKDSLSVDSTNFPTASDVLVKNGELFFPDIEAFRSVRDFVKTATENEIMRWQHQLGFESVNFHYVNAKKSLGVEETQEDWEKLKANFTDLIKIDGHKIRPRLEIGSFGWLIGRNNQLHVGKSIIYYTVDEYLISVPDGDLDKLERAKLTKQSDVGNGVYVHPVRSTTRLRTCPSYLGLYDVRSPSDTRKIDMEVAVVESIFTVTGGLSIEVAGTVYFDHEKRAAFGIWNGDQTQCTYDAAIVGNILVTSTGGGSSNIPFNFSENNFTTGNESRYTRIIPIFDDDILNGNGATVTISSIGLHLDQTSETGNSKISNLHIGCNW
ncbi:hypothetical protein [Haliscomenobacter sp.]|uniref:hypothetical protein n=1 Tax=Haliscomenobacter sp. TaxID=2717303 RepID=UPI003594054B